MDTSLLGLLAGQLEGGLGPVQEDPGLDSEPVVCAQGRSVRAPPPSQQPRGIGRGACHVAWGGAPAAPPPAVSPSQSPPRSRGQCFSSPRPCNAEKSPSQYWHEEAQAEGRSWGGV